mmetsp:Transcript_31820/g.46890  ORF Transcript_31820/g.46890 Transcript_31820/m.46890 type:complete len:157 (-) Transcript_31820:240-710(-)|eukprot:CAMPEP_0195519398 /NCGR_PEP_ID=MMETSP0794_2-20130614/14677_1 /TAXON_ID=515487 /ORGANISM="Stephanopyxis turris, Strain CCMP 815" /LENGTH=156 /DNA_ID=CAMNT_0040648537 /DNA_START=183 /DNA_END=653 /DNA_ORIENTATION=-
MPRLNDNASGPSVSAAYPSSRRTNFTSILMLLMFTLILRNLLFRDYRIEELEYLRSSGKSEEEIDRIIPKTESERRAKIVKSRANNMMLQHDVEVLQKEVAELKAKVFGEEAAITPSEKSAAQGTTTKLRAGKTTKAKVETSTDTNEKEEIEDSEK